MVNPNPSTLYKVGDGILDLFRQDHKSARYRSRLWYMLPVLFNLLGGIVAFFAIRHDDMDKAKNCLLLGIILFIPFILLGVAAVATAEIIGDGVSQLCTELSVAESNGITVQEGEFIQIFCD